MYLLFSSLLEIFNQRLRKFVSERLNNVCKRENSASSLSDINISDAESLRALPQIKREESAPP
jgi:hypothetical protein